MMYLSNQANMEKYPLVGLFIMSMHIEPSTYFNIFQYVPSYSNILMGHVVIMSNIVGPSKEMFIAD